jgi:hypothetical protein
MSDTLISPLDQRASLSSAEVSRITGIQPKTLIKYAHELGPKMGAFQPNGKWSGWRFKRKALEEWWAAFDTGRSTNKRRKS